MSTSENNKRIAKNTAFLYLRMLFNLAVSLFTARVILETLGIEDYGLNNVVGGVIGLFSIISAVLNSATSRFLTIELGKNDEKAMRKVYKNSMSLYIILCLIIFVLEETIGLYIVNNTLLIPEERLMACNLLYQMVVVSSVGGLLIVPAGSLLIAYERMNIFAYLGVGETLARLLVVYVVVLSPFDKLISLAILNLIVFVIFSVFKLVYCSRTFKNVYSNRIEWDRGLIGSMVSFSFWNLIGSAAYVLRIQGVNILINVFFGPIVNAANAIAYQINTAVGGFVTNFTTAVNPQITKSYASVKHDEMRNLIYRSGKFTFYLLMLLCFPILFETDFVLHLWLGNNIPEYTTIMTRLVLIISMVETFTYSIGCAVNATGKIRNYQLVICSVMLLIFPITWGCFKFGAPPYYGLVVYLFTSVIALMLRFHFMKTLLGISPIEYTKKVYLHTTLVGVIALILPSIVYLNMESGWVRFMVICVTTEISNVILIWLLGLDKSERNFVKLMLRKIHK